MLARFGVGVDNLDKSVCKQQSLHIANTAGASAVSVAEHVMACLLCMSRGIHKSNDDMHRGHWERWQGSQIHNKTLGIIGVGRIGREVARMSKLGFAMQNIGYVRKGKTNHSIEHFDMLSDDLLFVAQKSDAITLHLSLNEETNQLIDDVFFDTMKKSAYFLNTARAKLIKKDSLENAILQRKIAGVHLDVYGHEPYFKPKDVSKSNPSSLKEDPLLTKDTLLTPHVSSHTKEADYETARITVDNLLSHFNFLNNRLH